MMYEIVHIASLVIVIVVTKISVRLSALSVVKTNNMSTSLMDMQEDGQSSCCGAKVYMGICADCKEHCDAVGDEDEDTVCGCGCNKKSVDCKCTPADCPHIEAKIQSYKNKDEVEL